MPSARCLIPTALATAACAVVGSKATASSVDSDWYESLAKPSFQPPSWAFPVAWTALYTDIAVTTAAALDELEPAQRRRLAVALGVNLGLNAGWCWMFFGRREIAAAVPIAVALAVSSADLVHRVGTARGGLGVALSPYAIWTAFASALNMAIVDLNS